MPLDKARLFIREFNLVSNDKIAEICINIPKHYLKEKPDGQYIRGVTNWSENPENPGEWKLRGGPMSVVADSLVPLLKEIHHLPEDLQLFNVNVVDLHWGRPAPSKDGLWKAVIKALKETNSS